MLQSPRPIPEAESLNVEFKSDVEPISDSELVAAVVCMANSDGGDLFIGVEDDGTITGLHERHRNVGGLAALVANRTNPPQSVQVARIEVDGKTVAHVAVARSESIVSSSDGLVVRRRLKADGTPECVPFYPHEFAQRASDLRRLDYSALPLTGASTDDFDPLERERLRQMIARYGGDSTLLALGDSELDGALGFTHREGDARVPTVAGLLVIGREGALRQHVPTHEVALQDMSGTKVRLNEFTRAPLLRGI